MASVFFFFFFCTISETGDKKRDKFSSPDKTHTMVSYYLSAHWPVNGHCRYVVEPLEVPWSVVMAVEYEYVT